MATRTTTRVVTPRRRKAWATSTNGSTATSFTAGQSQIAASLLASLATDLGVSNFNGLTVMRIVGNISLVTTAGASTFTPWSLFWGITWVSLAIANASSGDAQIPDPDAGGADEARWIQRGVLRGLALDDGALGADMLLSANGQHESYTNLDITQMRKQPTADSRLVMIVKPLAVSGQGPGAMMNFHTMVALP